MKPLRFIARIFVRKSAPQSQLQPEQAPSKLRQARKLNKRGGKRRHGHGAQRINPNAPILDQARQVQR